MNNFSFFDSCGTSNIVDLPRMMSDLISSHKGNCIFTQVLVTKREVDSFPSNKMEEYYVAILGFDS